jgi:hypothetical protein
MTEKLENLAAAAQSLDDELSNATNGPGVPPTSEELPLDSEAKEWAMVAYAIGQAAGQFAPKLKQIYSEEACLAWGHTVVPVAQKYDVKGIGRFPEVALILSTLAFAYPTYMEIKAITSAIEMEAKKAAQQKPVPATNEPPEKV